MASFLKKLFNVGSLPNSTAVLPAAASNSDDLVQAIALEEYKALRAEILDRVKNEFVLITASATLTGAGVALWAQSSTRSVTLLLALPLLSFLLAFLHFAQENSIAAAAAYLNKNVRPRLLAFISPATVGRADVMAWEDFRSQAIYKAPWSIQAVTAIGVSTPAVPGIVVTVAMTVRLLWLDYRESLHPLDWVLIGANWTFIALIVVAGVHNVKMYKTIT
jgi:hypothetical protein